MAPTVPLYGDRKIEEAGLKRTPLSTETPSIGAFGGGERLSQGAGMVEKIILDAKKEADEVAVQDFDNNLALINKELSAKALSRKGKDAFNLPTEISEEYDSKISQLEKNLSGSTQRSIAKQRAFERKQQLLSAAEKHSSAEIGVYKASVYETGIKIDREEALLNSNDPVFVDSSIKKQHDKLDKLAEQSAEIQGKLPLLKLEASSKTYSSILEKKINAFNEVGGVEETKAYFDKVKGLMTEDDKLKSETALEKATLDYKGLLNSDKLFEKYKYSPTKVQEELMKIKDPAERKVTRDYFNQAMTDFKAFENFQQEQTMRGVYNKIKDTKGDLKALRPMIRGLDARDQEWFEKIAEEERNGSSKNRASDPTTYYGLLEMTKNKEDFNKLQQMNLLKPEIAGKLSPKHHEMFLNMQKKGFDDVETKFNSEAFKTINLIAEEAGVKVPSKKSPKQIVQRYNQFFETVKEQARASGDTSPENVAKISRQLTKEAVLNKKSFWFDSSSMAFEAKPEDVDLEDISPDLMQEIRSDFLKKTGREPNPVEVQNMYVKALKQGLIE